MISGPSAHQPNGPAPHEPLTGSANDSRPTTQVRNTRPGVCGALAQLAE